MLAWLTENGGTILVCLLVCGMIGGAVGSLIRDKRKGKCHCGGQCGSCPMEHSCHKR